MNALSNKEPDETVGRFSSERRSNDRYGDDSEKRVKLTKAAVEATIRQASLESAISTTDQLSQDVSMETHLSRCEFWNCSS